MNAKSNSKTKTRIINWKLPPEYEKARKLLTILKGSNILADKYKGRQLGEVEYLELWDTLLKLVKGNEEK